MKILLFCSLLLGSASCSHAQQTVTVQRTYQPNNFTQVWGMSPQQVRSHMQSAENEYTFAGEKQKATLRLLTYEDTSRPGVTKTYCFANNQLVTIRIDRDVTKVLATVPQGQPSTSEMDTWRDEPNDLVTQRRYEDGVLSDFLLSNKANPAK